MSAVSRPSRQKSWRTGRERVSVLAALAIQKESVSRKLAQLRVDHADPKTGKDLTQEKAAARVHVSMRQWQRWETGQSIPYPRNLDTIAAEFGFDVSEFFDDDVEQATDTPDPFNGNGPPSDMSERLDRLEEQLEAILNLLRPPTEDADPDLPPAPPAAFEPTPDTARREPRTRQSRGSGRQGA